MESKTIKFERDGSQHEAHYVTTAEALALIKKSYVKGICYTVRLSTTFVTEVNEADEAVRGYSDMSTLLSVSQADALRVVAKWMSKVFEEKGARLEIRVVDDKFGGRFVHIG